MICCLCLKESELYHSIYEDDSIMTALRKHFDGLIDFRDKSQDSSVCSPCRQIVDDFHKFYSTVEEAQIKFKTGLADLKCRSQTIQRSPESNRDSLMEVEIEIKEEYVENLWHDVATELSGATQINENPLYEPENVVLDAGNDNRLNPEAATCNIMELTDDMLEDCLKSPAKKLEVDDSHPTSDTMMTTRRVTRARNAKSGKRKAIPSDEETDEKIERVKTDKRNKVEKERKPRTPRVKSISPNDDEIIKKHISMNCELCAVSTENFVEMRNHFRAFHGDIKPYVLCCGRKLNKRFLLVQHAYKHEDPEFFKCAECQKVFSDNYVLRSHILANHATEEELNYECDQCDKRFSRRYLLELHKPSHIPVNERKFACDKCPDSKAFASGHLLSIHMNMRHKKATNVCHVCAKEIRDNQAYEKHVRLHFEDSGPRVKCPRPNCDRWLKDEDNLKQHLRRHNDEGKVFTCDECGKLCKNRRALHSHLKYAHSNVVFSCDECNKSFKKAITLMEHMAQHTGESLYKCPFCTRTFNSNANMHSHKKKMHPVEWDVWRKTKRGSSQKLINKQPNRDNLQLAPFNPSNLIQ